MSSPWAGDAVLADGSTVHIRPITVADRDALIRFHEHQGRDSLYYRYFSAKAGLSEEEATRFSDADMRDHAGLVAIDGDEMIAWASYDRWPGRDDADVAFLTDDAHHGRGIATILLEHLAAIATAAGITRFTAEVLGDNRPMLSVFAKAGWPLQRAFDSGVVDLSWDIAPTSAVLDTIERREQVGDVRSVARLLAPRSVAVIGASDRPGSVGRAVTANLVHGGFDGPVHLVNPNRAEVFGLPTVASVEDVVGDVGLAVVAVPAGDLAAVIEQCSRKRVRGAIVLTAVADGFPIAELVSFARRHGMRIIGPGSMGVFTTASERGLVAHLAPGRLRAGPVAVSMQSGSLGASFLEHAHRLGIGISSFVSLGDKADISGNDLLQYWEDDGRTAVVAMYTESFGNPRKFARIARRVARRRPIVAVRAGTGSLGGADDALYQQTGVIRVPTVLDLLDTVRLLAGQPLPSGDRVAIVTNSASPAVLATGALRAEGLRVAEPLAPLSASLTKPWVELPWNTEPAAFAAAVAAAASRPDVDAVIAIHAPPVADAVEAPAVELDRVLRSAERSVPVLAVLLGRDDSPLVPGSPVPAFAFPEPAVAALARTVRYARWRRVRAEAEEAGRPDEPGPDGRSGDLRPDDVAAAIDHALSIRPGGTLLPLVVVGGILAAYGIRFAGARAVASLDAGIAAATDLGFPVALKAATGEPRRGVAGGVALDLTDVEAVAHAWEAMEAARGGPVVEAVVQQMVPGGVEARVRIEHDGMLGALLAVGIGGIFADAIGDRVHRLPPLDHLDASEVVGSSRLGPALARDAAGRAHLVDALQRISRLVDDHPRIDAMDLNPLLVSAEGCWVVDAAIHVAPSEVAPPLRRLV